MIRYPSCKVILATGERDRYKEGYRIHATALCDEAL